jgi:hypothetical protein
MNTRHQFLEKYGNMLSAIVSSMILSVACLGQTIPGLPEPGLIIYGPVTNTSGNLAISSFPTIWRTSGGGSSVTVTSVVASLNGQYFHITRLPFETRYVSGQALGITPNTLPLTNGVTFTRSATVKGQPATIVSSSRGMLDQFTFSVGDRGLVERVVLSVNLPAMTYDEWIAQYPSIPANQRGKNDDPDGDGLTNWGEFVAGTDPTLANSSFRFVDLRPDLDGSLWLLWSSVAGKTYSIQRAESLGSNFNLLKASIPATPGTNTFHDTSATGPGPYFYRLTVE